MADKAIGSLTQATTFGPSDLIVLEQDNTAKSMLGQTLVTLLGNQLQAKGGITSLTEMPEFSTSSTYELNTYVTRSGKIYKCINAITTAGSWDSTKWSEQESYSTALQIPYLIDYKVDEEYDYFIVSQGDGITSYEIRYQAHSSGTSAPTDTWSSSVVNATSAKPYVWTRIKLTRISGSTVTAYSVSMTPYISIGSVTASQVAEGGNPTATVTSTVSGANNTFAFTFGIPVGATGAGASLTSYGNQFAYSATTSTPATWYSTVAAAAAAYGSSTQGAYLFTRTSYTFNDGNTAYGISMSYQGIDGTGLSGVVKSLYSSDSQQSLAPDANGQVTVSASSLGLIKDPSTKSSGQVLAYDSNAGWYASDVQSPLTFDTAPTSGSTNPVTSNGIYTAVNAKVSKLSFTNKSVTTSNWSAVSTSASDYYADFPYKANISCSGVTSTHFAQVVLAPADAISGNIAPINQTGSNIVTIYAASPVALTIPQIVAFI